MPKSENQKAKIIYELEYLKEKSDEEHPISTRDMIAYLDSKGISAERKAIYRDMDELKELGYEIVKNPSRSGGGFYLANRDFETSELKILIDLVQSSKFISKSYTDKMVDKIEHLTSDHIAEGLKHTVFYLDRIKTNSKSVFYTVDDVHNAISSDCSITFKYVKYNTKKELVEEKGGKEYRVSPYYLVSNSDNYYLIGYDEKAEGEKETDKIRTYRVDRMKTVRKNDAKRKGKEAFRDFNVSKYVNSAFGMYLGEPQLMRLSFPEKLVDVMIDRFGKDVIVTPTGDGRCFIDVNIVSSNQFFGWLTGIGQGLKLESPEESVLAYKKFLKDILANYK